MSEELEQIKTLYYRTSKATIAQDFDLAVDLLKKMANEDERERATVFMHGLAEMKAEWLRPSGGRPVNPSRASGEPQSAAARRRSDRSKRAGRRPRSND